MIDKGIGLFIIGAQENEFSKTENHIIYHQSVICIKEEITQESSLIVTIYEGPLSWKKCSCHLH